ncbi:DJ-1/PfpI family protein [candidate division KSB1 bacterium]
MKRTKLLILIAVFCFLSINNAAGQEAKKTDSNDVAVMVLLGEWFGDTYFPLKEHLEFLGWKMVRVGIDSTYRGCYNKARGVELKTDVFIQDIKDFSKYDCLIIPSGPQWRKFNTNDEVLEFVRKVHEEGVLIASFCVGNLTVSAAGLTDLERKTGLFPEKVTKIKEGILLGPRGGGPPPGDGFKSAPIEAVCKAIAEELNIEIKEK